MEGLVIEPMIKPQWYVNYNGIAKEALDAVMDENNKKIDILPKQYAAEWKRWLENIRDWCVSRRLWWGHRVPAWYVTLEDDKLKEHMRLLTNIRKILTTEDGYWIASFFER
uniref:valine--tRNA ligase n=1 Tax=Lactuca sativa TaxID=4236 RepID=A0A9R1VYT2_LACSA|nr:hypothetical protein LSAT_V11C400173670 [Lactuca sativa]